MTFYDLCIEIETLNRPK